MKSRPDDQILTALQQTVSTVLKQWLDDNKGEVLRAVRAAVLEHQSATKEQPVQTVKSTEYLTVDEVAQRWKLHPESVRRMTRQGRLPRTIVSRRSLVARSTVEALEKGGTTPSRFLS